MSRTTRIQAPRNLASDIDELRDRIDHKSALVDDVRNVTQDIEIRLRLLEAELEGCDASNNDPQTMAEARHIIAMLQVEVMQRLLRGMTKTGYLPNDDFGPEEENLEPLPEIVDRQSLTRYLSMVTTRMQSKVITPAEAKSLMYAAQVAMQGQRLPDAQRVA